MFKTVFYNGLGVNQALQKSIHSITEYELYYNLMLIGSHFFGNYMLFPVHMTLIVILLVFVIHKKNQKLSKSSLTQYHSDIIKSGYVMLVSLFIGAICIELSKFYFALPRPFCANSLSQISLTNNCFRSMPSGHSAYVTIMVISIWPLLNALFKCMAVIILLWVYISRIALDMHYPADVFYSVLIAGIIAFFVIKYIDKFSHRFSSMNYHMMKFLARV